MKIYETDSSYTRSGKVEITLNETKFNNDIDVKNISIFAEIEYREENNLPPEVSFSFSTFNLDDTPIISFFENIKNEEHSKLVEQVMDSVDSSCSWYEILSEICDDVEFIESSSKRGDLYYDLQESILALDDDEFINFIRGFDLDYSNYQKAINEDEVSDLVIELQTEIMEWFSTNGYIKALDDELVTIRNF